MGLRLNLIGTKALNDDGIGGEHIYMPRFNHRDGRKRDYLRGFGAQFWNTGAHPGPRWAKAIPGFGADFKKSVKDRFPALVSMHPYGEVLPRAGQSRNGRRHTRRSLRRAASAHHLQSLGKRTQDGGGHVRHGGGNHEAGKGRDASLTSAARSISWEARFTSTVRAAWGQIRNDRR